MIHNTRTWHGGRYGLGDRSRRRRSSSSTSSSSNETGTVACIRRHQRHTQTIHICPSLQKPSRHRNVAVSGAVSDAETKQQPSTAASQWQPVAQGLLVQDTHTHATTNNETSQQLSNQKLFQRIRACQSWADCLQLLHTAGPYLDAMLISSLCTHTVRLYEAQRYLQSAVDAGQRGQVTSRISSCHHSGDKQLVNGSSPGNDCSKTMESTGNNSVDRLHTYSRRTSMGSQRQSDFLQYIPALAHHALAMACSGTFRAQQYSNVLWCFARCDTVLPSAWVDSYFLQAQQELARFPPRNLAQVIWATAKLKLHPPTSFISTYLWASATKLPYFKAIDLANTLWAFGTLGVHPPTTWINAALSASASCWAQFKPFELSITVWSLARLGVRFELPQYLSDTTQQQQQRAVSEPTEVTRLAAAAAAAAEDVPTVQTTGFGWLLASIARVTPAMGLQEVANLLWGLAAGKAVLCQQHVQALGGQACIILAQADPPSRPSTVSLTVCMWALAKLSWQPTLSQAQIVERLLPKALFSGSLDVRHAALLVFSLGKLQLRPPLSVMQHFMSGFSHCMQEARTADLLQVLGGCDKLGWSVGDSWWRCFYTEGLPALREASAAELSVLLASMAVLKAPSPTYQWWEDFWGHSGVEIESAVAAKGLSHIAHTRNLPKHNISMLAGSFKRMQQTPCLQHWPEPQQQQHKKHLVADMEASAEHWFVSDSSSSNSSNSSRSWHTHPLAELHMAEALQIVTNLQDVAKQHAQCRATAHLDTEGYQVMSAPRAAALLWASARLQRMPPKVLLWQLLLLILIDVHSLNPRYLTAVLQAIGGLQQRFGKRQVECFRVIKPIVLAVQWRLLVGLAGTTPREQQQVMKSLRFAASQNGQLMSIMLLHKISSAKHSPSSFLKDCSILMV